MLNPDTQVQQTLGGQEFIITDFRNGRTIGLSLAYNI